VRIALDTNVVLDVLLAREPFAAESAAVLARVETGKAVGILAATTITTIHYLVAKNFGRSASLQAIHRLLGLCEIAPVNRAVLTSAAGSKIPDFEDAVLHDAASSLQAAAIVSRNPKDFKEAVLPVLSPAEAILRIDAARAAGGD
jgi:predicted nucleic acid-binding protein